MMIKEKLNSMTGLQKENKIRKLEIKIRNYRSGDAGINPLIYNTARYFKSIYKKRRWVLAE